VTIQTRKLKVSYPKSILIILLSSYRVYLFFSDLIKRKTKLAKDSSRLNELGDAVFRLGYLYYQKGYCKEALDEFENALEIRKKLPAMIDVATAHRFIGETLCKMGANFERAKSELDKYHSINLRLNDIVEIQRSHTTLGNYYMTLAENKYLDKRVEYLNEAFAHYLKSYEILDEISERRLVDSKEFGLMKARTCLNCGNLIQTKN
jgi:tetratricopeptide (TPR) repeat protein